MPPKRVPKKPVAHKAVPLKERSAWFNTGSCVALTTIVWCSRANRPVILVWSQKSMDLHVPLTLTCSECTLDYDPKGDWDHTYMGNAVRPY